MKLAAPRGRHEHFDNGSSTPCNRGYDWNGRRIRPSLRTRARGRPSGDRYRTQEARHLASKAERGFAPRLCGPLRTLGRAVGSGRSDPLPGHIYRGGVGRGSPQDRGTCLSNSRARCRVSRKSPSRYYDTPIGQKALPADNALGRNKIFSAHRQRSHFG